MKKKMLVVLIMSALLCVLAVSVSSAATVEDVNGNRGSLYNYLNGKNTIVVIRHVEYKEDFDQLEFDRTEILLDEIQPSIKTLSDYGISVVVLINSDGSDWVLENELSERAKQHPGITFLRILDEAPLQDWVNELHLEGRFALPLVFIRNAAGKLLEFLEGGEEPGDMVAVRAVKLITGETIEPIKYKLTVKMLRVDDETEIAPPIVKQYHVHEIYSVAAPEIDGYRPHKSMIVEFKKDEDEEIVFYYEDIPESYPDKPELVVIADKDHLVLGETVHVRFYVKYMKYDPDRGKIVDGVREWPSKDKYYGGFWIPDNDAHSPFYQHVFRNEGSLTYTVSESPDVKQLIITIMAGYGDDGPSVTEILYIPVDNTQKYDPDKPLKDFVSRCYSIILNREPDAGGMQTWVNELNSGRKTASEIIDRFVNSPEFTGKMYSNGEAVDILYQAMLGRNADAGGKANWVKKLESGQTLAHVINGFCFSKEFRGLCDSYGIKAGFVNIENTDTTAEGKIKAFVQRCYRIILDREADPSGMQTWYEQLSSGKKAAAEIIDRFVNSPEFSGKRYSHSDSVEILYKAMLGRGSDAAGKANWVGKLDAGQPFAVVINGFCVSKEFTGICASYGIKPGNVNIQLSAQSEEELSMLALNAKAPITRRSETKPNRVEIINPSDTVDMNIGTAVQAVYINDEKAKEFIGRCYRVILGREASEAEVENWIGQMVNGTKSPDQIARGFLFSNEFKAKNINNENLVKILYRVYMNREADAEGLATWTRKLNEGTSLQELLNTFSQTSEFKAVVKGMAN